MQKLVTVAINLEQLRETSEGTFTMTHIEEINNLLHEGWIIEEYEFLSGGNNDEQAVVLFILNDETVSELDLSEEVLDEENESLLDDGPKEDDEDEELDDEDKDESNRTHANAPMI